MDMVVVVVVVVVLQVLTTVERVYQGIVVVAQIVLMEVTLLLTNHLPLTTVTYMQTSDHEIHHCLLLQKDNKVLIVLLEQPEEIAKQYLKLIPRQIRFHLNIRNTF